MSIGTSIAAVGKRSVRPGWPSLKMTTALAPAALALAALRLKSQVPRWTSAMLPDTAAGKSAASQPLDEFGAGAGGISMSVVGTSRPVTSPEPENGMVVKSVSSTKVFGVGAVSAKVPGPSSS